MIKLYCSASSQIRERRYYPALKTLRDLELLYLQDASVGDNSLPPSYQNIVSSHQCRVSQHHTLLYVLIHAHSCYTLTHSKGNKILVHKADERDGTVTKAKSEVCHFGRARDNAQHVLPFPRCARRHGGLAAVAASHQRSPPSLPFSRAVSLRLPVVV